MAVARDARGVFGTDVHLGAAAPTTAVIFSFHAGTQTLNVVAVNGAPGQHNLEVIFNTDYLYKLKPSTYVLRT